MATNLQCVIGFAQQSCHYFPSVFAFCSPKCVFRSLSLIHLHLQTFLVQITGNRISGGLNNKKIQCNITRSHSIGQSLDW